MRLSKEKSSKILKSHFLKIFFITSFTKLKNSKVETSTESDHYLIKRVDKRRATTDEMCPSSIGSLLWI